MKGAYDKRRWNKYENTTTFNLFVGDGAVAYQHVENQNPVWGYTIIGLMFLPNLVFILWVVLGNKRQEQKMADEKRVHDQKMWGLTQWKNENQKKS